MTRRTRWQRTRPTLGQVQAWDAIQGPGLRSVCRCGHEWQRGEKRCPKCQAWAVEPAPRETQLDDEDRAALDQFAPSKPVPRETVPTEQEEHRNLAKWIRLQWWAKGARRLESQASRGVREQAQLAAEGGEFLAGNPDWIVFVPAFNDEVETSGPMGTMITGFGPMTLALELKRRDAGKTRPDTEWWLHERWPWQIRGEVENPRSEHFGLSWAQACALRSMHAAGVRTFVAYGWDDAAEWLERQIGPRPAVDPDWGW